VSPSEWLQDAADRGAVLPTLRTLRETRAAAASTDPVTVVAAVRRAAHCADWTSATRDAVICDALQNDACPEAVRTFAAQYWSTEPRSLAPKPGGKLAAMCRDRAVVHVAEWGTSRAEVVPVCHGRSVKWCARWTGADALSVEVTCKRCRRSLETGRVRWTD
jgi:hypothetical protein